MAKTGIRHIAENLQILSIQYKNKNFEKTKKKTNKSKVQKSENEEIGKSKYKSTKFAKRLHNTSCICSVKPTPNMHPSFETKQVTGTAIAAVKMHRRPPLCYALLVISRSQRT